MFVVVNEIEVVVVKISALLIFSVDAVLVSSSFLFSSVFLAVFNSLLSVPVSSKLNKIFFSLPFIVTYDSF